MEFTETLIGYYRGERNEAWWLVVTGVLLLGIGAIIWKNMFTNEVLRGLFYPILFLGMVASCAGAFNVWNNQRRLDTFPKEYQINPEMFVSKEVDRFQGKGGVNSWWQPLKITWTLFLLSGVALGFWSTSGWWHGFALGLLLWGTFGWVVDAFAHQRAKLYTLELVQQ